MPDRSDYPAKDNVRVANPDSTGRVEFGPHNPFADIIRNSGTPVTGIEPPIKDLDGDNLTLVDVWIDYIAAADDPANDQFLSETHPDARPSWLVPATMGQLTDSLGITQAVAWFGDETSGKVDTTQFHTNLAWYAIKLKISDGANEVIGSFRLYPVGSTPTLAVPNFYVWDSSLAAENNDLEAYTKADGTFLGEIHTDLTGATYSIKHMGAMVVNRLSTPQRLWFTALAFTTNRSYLWSIKTDGSDPIEHVELTDGAGSVGKAIAIDEQAGLIFVARDHQKIQKIAVAAPSMWSGLTNVDVGNFTDGGLAVRPEASKLYYGTDNTPGVSIRSINYDDTGDAELASSSALSTAGISTTNANDVIWGMAYNPQDLHLYCIQQDGTLFKVNTQTGAVTKLMDPADWDQIGATSDGDFRYLEIDEQNQALWVAQSVSNTGDRYAWKVPIGNEAAGNTREFQFASAASSNRWFTFCLGPIFIVSI